MQYQNRFPIFRDATALVVAIESAVRLFPRYHKYTLGSEMRTNAVAASMADSATSLRSAQSDGRGSSAFLHHAAFSLRHAAPLLRHAASSRSIHSLQNNSPKDCCLPISQLNALQTYLQRHQMAYIFVSEQGYQHNRLKQRKLRLLYHPQGLQS